MTIPSKAISQKYVKLSPSVTPIKITATGASKPVVPKKSKQQLFRDGGDYLAPYIKPNAYPFVEQLRAASLAGDFERLFQLMPKNQWTNIPLGKFRFAWGPDGKPRWVTFSQQDMQNYFRGPWLVIDKSWGETCPEDFIKKYAYDYWAEHARSASLRPNTHPHHMYRKMYPARLVCKAKKGSVWVRVRKPVMIAAAIVTAVYLGPAILGKIKALSGVNAAGSGKVLAGSQKLVGAVNKGRTIQAMAKGKLPPPPVSIGGSSWREWATLVAKDELQDQMQRKITAQEEQAIKIEIAQMQRELVATTPVNVQRTPAIPDQYLAPAIQSMQMREGQKAESTSEILKIALLVGIPAALLLGVG